MRVERRPAVMTSDGICHAIARSIDGARAGLRGVNERGQRLDRAQVFDRMKKIEKILS
jgi:hypothetical protein